MKVWQDRWAINKSIFVTLGVNFERHFGYVDSLKSFLDTMNAMYFQTKIQLYIVNFARKNLKLISWKDAKALAADLVRVYQARTET